MNNLQSEKQSELVQNARTTYSRALLNLALYAFFCQVFVILFSSISRSVLGTDTLPTLLRYAIQFGTMYALGLPFYLRLSKEVPVSPPKQHKIKAWHLILCIPCLLCLMYIGNLTGMFITWLIAKISGVNTESTMIQDNVYGEYGYVMILAAVLCAPFVEEMLFRKVLIDRIRKYGDGKAILLSGIFFGLFHGNLTQLFYTTLVGLFFAFVYVRTGKVIYTIILHTAINFIGGAMPYFVHADTVIKAINEKNYLSVLTNTPFMIYALAVISTAVIGLVLLIVFHGQYELDEPETLLPKGTRRYAVTANIGFWAMVLFCVYDFTIQILKG